MSAATFATEAAAAILAGTSATVRMAHDHRVDLDRVPPGETWFGLRVDVFTVDARNVSMQRTQVDALAVMIHRLADWQNERAYTEAEMLADQTVLTDPAFWRGIPSAQEEIGGPEIEDSAERIGNVILYTVQVRLYLKP